MNGGMRSEARPASGLLAVFALIGLTICSGALPAGYTYQGRLLDSGAPVSGQFDLQFSLYATQTGGTPLTPPEERLALTLEQGYFATSLDFGGALSMQGDLWLEIEIRPAGAVGYTRLAPRNPVMPAPRAALAYRIGTGGVDSAAIEDQSVTASDLAAGSIGSDELVAGAIGPDDVADGAIGTAELPFDAVTADQIATNAVEEAQIAPGAVGAQDIAENSVGTSELATGSVDTSELDTNSITAEKLQPASVGTSELAAGAVTSIRRARLSRPPARWSGGIRASSDSSTAMKSSCASMTHARRDRPSAA